MSSCDRIGVAPAMDMPEVLKSLLEHSLPWPEKRTDKEKGKEKLEEDEASAASTMAVSASLMPPIWDKTIPYDGESSQLNWEGTSGAQTSSPRALRRPRPPQSPPRAVEARLRRASPSLAPLRLLR
ncbi:TEF transcription factor, PAR bZIP family member [Phyllostomus discolor]|uniref:TEF transcription factor, PAR bZIP family member n=1 Tax=Phyllostomus discolor TaxID=89673 RepID=A0A834B2P3_9CHIR|nr:TEF transcription factor, PAR bZIP family member [Phyllostomus discolor]